MSKTESFEVQESAVGEDKVISPNVPVKYRGTRQDAVDMATLGKKQVLRRQFKYDIARSEITQAYGHPLIVRCLRLQIHHYARFRFHGDGPY